MEISFVKSQNTIHRNEQPVHTPVTPVSRGQKLDSVSGNIRSGLNAAETNPEQLLEQTVEASAHEGAIDGAHDFNMARIMELLSDPLLQEDVPE
ncbi:MAG TPA: hypothetical protein DCS48_09600 [Desulfovibrio sp.]|nr:hypothetical protein [Desulfovibrio sp.]